MKSLVERPHLWAWLLVVLAVGCNGLKTADLPGSHDLTSATAYLFILKEEGKLPGIKKEDRGTFRSVPISIPKDDTGGPLALTVRATVSDKKGVVFWYGLAKANQGVEWRLVNAWRTDAKGARVDLAVPE